MEQCIKPHEKSINIEEDIITDVEFAEYIKNKNKEENHDLMELYKFHSKFDELDRQDRKYGGPFFKDSPYYDFINKEFSKLNDISIDEALAARFANIIMTRLDKIKGADYEKLRSDFLHKLFYGSDLTSETFNKVFKAMIKYRIGTLEKMMIKNQLRSAADKSTNNFEPKPLIEKSRNWFLKFIGYNSWFVESENKKIKFLNERLDDYKQLKALESTDLSKLDQTTKEAILYDTKRMKKVSNSQSSKTENRNIAIELTPQQFTKCSSFSSNVGHIVK